MDCRQIPPGSGDPRKMMDNWQMSSDSRNPRKCEDVIQVNQGTFILKERWTGPEVNQSGGFGTGKSQNGNDKMKKEVLPEESESPRQNIDSRLKKLMSGDLESIPVFMLDYRAEWLDSDKKKRHQHEKKLKKKDVEGRFIDKSKEHIIKLENSNNQISNVETLLKNINMSSESIKNKEKSKDSPLEEQLRIKGSVDNLIPTEATTEVKNLSRKVDEDESLQLIDDVDVDFIVRQYPLQKALDGSKPSGLSKKLVLGHQKDNKHVLSGNNPEQKGFIHHLKIDKHVEETTSSIEPIKPQSNPQIEQVRPRKRTYAEMIGYFEDKVKDLAKRTIKRKLEEQVMKDAMESFEKWWEEQENKYKLKLNDEKKDIPGAKVMKLE